ncbi:MAG TPA: HD domain-containing phosphohydrolase [Patescibacteria group bacterium]|nr:HD domain-containing phosphohydrolase [Patescibacteria group bacterium]
MRRVGLSCLNGKEQLARAIYDEEGRVLLREGILLTPSFIQRLQALGITAAYIEDEISQGIEINDVVSEETRQESKRAIASTMNRLIRRGDISLQGIVTASQKIIDDILPQKEVMVNLIDIRSTADALFSHSVNVCILAVITAINMGYNIAKMKELATGALLHDIGKTKITRENPPGSNRFSIDRTKYREHPKLGYDILNKHSIDAYIKTIVLTHHEHCDGSGFPLGLHKEEIYEMAKIVSICNAFDNILHGNQEEYQVPPYQVIEFLEASPDIFDANIIKNLVVNVSVYPSGCKVELNSGELCIVVRQNLGFPSRPVVRVLADGNNTEHDLSQELSIFIEKMRDD